MVRHCEERVPERRGNLLCGELSLERDCFVGCGAASSQRRSVRFWRENPDKIIGKICQVLPEEGDT